jgi:Rieske 2Fe-2S family protein
MEELVVKPRDVMPEGARTLPARYYTDPALFKAELDGLFGKMWFYVGRSEEAARAGQYFVREVNGYNIVVTRNASDGIKAFHNTCRHRGTRICSEMTGQFAGSIQCPYHAWTYDLDGRLIGAPHMDEVPHFRKSEYPLLGIQAAEWDGHIFLNLDETASPLDEQLGPLVAKFRDWRMQDLRLGHRIVYDVKANWKLIIQNYNECLHCPNLHPALNKLSHYLSGENEPLRTTYMGGRMDLRRASTRCRWTGRARARSCRGYRPTTRAACTTTASSRT